MGRLGTEHGAAVVVHTTPNIATAHLIIYYVNFLAGESGDEYIEREDYPMCQQVYDSEEYSYSEGEQISSGDEFDREEELRGYNRAIDFTLHTIIEESCEDSEPENRSLKSTDKKRHSDPSELEKYFFYGVGGGNVDQSVHEESEYSDNSDTNSLKNEHIKAMRETSVDGADLTSSRLEKYFMSGFNEEEDSKQHSLDAISETGNDTDDSGSVGSESDGIDQKNFDHRRKKTTGRPRGFRSERLSDRTESGAETSGNLEHDGVHDVSYSSESGEDNTAFVSGDGSFDTIKRKKNKGRKQSDERRSDSERAGEAVRRSSAMSEVPQVHKSAEQGADTQASGLGGVHECVHKKDDKSSPKQASSNTPLPNSATDMHQAHHNSNINADSSMKSKQQHISPSGSDKEPDGMKTRGQGSSKDSPSTSPPPVGGPVRKHKSRDSGFVGSNDDLLRNESGQMLMSSSDTDRQSKNQTESSSDGEHDHRQQTKIKTRLEKVSEVSENTEDDCDKSTDGKIQASSRLTKGHSSDPNSARKKSVDADVGRDTSETLTRKDSFHQWSSDEETNIMMNRMRAFFRNMLAGAGKSKQLEPAKKPAQIVHFEQQLTRLMKTVPGINDDQVKELVEYLSSEDTWSDSCDSSDYTDYTSSDLETPFAEDPVIPDMDVEISASVHQDMMQKTEGKKSPGSGPNSDIIGESEDFQKETAIMYQKLMTSIAKMQHSQQEEAKVKVTEAKKSPPIAAKILHHISSRLVTLMHEVSASDNSSTASMSDSRQNLYLSSKDFKNMVTSSPKSKSSSRRHRLLEGSSSIDSNKSDDNDGDRRRAKLASLKSSNVDSDNENSYTFNSLDSPKVLIGPNLGTSPKSNPFKFTKNTSKSVEVLDLGRRRASLDDKSLKMSMGKSTSSEYDVWHGVYRDQDQRRGSLPRSQLELGPAHHSASSGGVADMGTVDDERFSWKGSFESALAADPRTRLSIEAKRRSIGSDCASDMFSSVEQMDRTGSKSSLAASRSPSQSSKRSLRSSLPNSRSSLHTSRSEKDIASNMARAQAEVSSSTPSSEVKLSTTHDSDSDDQSAGSSSVRSSMSSRYGRRSSVPEAQVLARLSEDSAPGSGSGSPVPPATSAAAAVTISSARAVSGHSTNSLPRLGTSSIQKTKTSSSTLLNSSGSGPSQPSNIATSTQGNSHNQRDMEPVYSSPLHGVSSVRDTVWTVDSMIRTQ